MPFSGNTSDLSPRNTIAEKKNEQNVILEDRLEDIKVMGPQVWRSLISQYLRCCFKEIMLL